jgi:hypothetical protein
MCAAVVFSVRLDAVPDDSAIAMAAYRREAVNCALEAIEHMSLTGGGDFERQLIVVSADFTLRHFILLEAWTVPRPIVYLS